MLTHYPFLTEPFSRLSYDAAFAKAEKAKSKKEKDKREAEEELELAKQR